MKVAVFSRGRGHGHAIPDIALCSLMSKQDPTLQFNYISYSIGAKTFSTAGVPVFDLQLGEANPFIETLHKALRAIDHLRPDVIIAHEEFAAVTAGTIKSIPTLFLSAWIPQNGTIAADALGDAKSIVIIDNPGIFPIPTGIRIKPVYTGPLIRRMLFTRRDKETLRADEQLNQASLIIGVLPGGSCEARAPDRLIDLVVSAFHILPATPKQLVWIGGKDITLVQQKIGHMRNVRVIEFANPVERILSLCDIIITKGTRGATLDAAAVGVPSISLSNGNNPIDDILVPRIPTNLALFANAVRPDDLSEYIQIISQQLLAPVPSTDTRVAAKVLGELKRICGEYNP